MRLENINFKLNSVYDPDTIRVTFEGAGRFSAFTTNVPCRIMWMDSPEKGWRAKSDAERRLEEIGRNRLNQLFAESKKVAATVHDKKDRNGRFLIEVFFDGLSWSEIAINEKLAVFYEGKKARNTDWFEFCQKHHPYLI